MDHGNGQHRAAGAQQAVSCIQDQEFPVMNAIRQRSRGVFMTGCQPLQSCIASLFGQTFLRLPLRAFEGIQRPHAVRVYTSKVNLRLQSYNRRSEAAGMHAQTCGLQRRCRTRIYIGTQDTLSRPLQGIDGRSVCSIQHEASFLFQV